MSLEVPLPHARTARTPGVADRSVQAVGEGRASYHPSLLGSCGSDPFADPPPKCLKTSAPQRASAGSSGALLAHLRGPAQDSGCRRRRPLGLRCRAPVAALPLRFASRQWTEDVLGSCLASPALCAGCRKAWGGGSSGPGLGGRHRGPRPRAIWTPSAGPFEVVRGGSLFARPLWLGAWRWFTASMPLNLFPGDPGSIRPGPEPGCQASSEIKGGTGLFIEVELRAGGALGLGCSSDPRADCRVRKLERGLHGPGPLERTFP